MSRSGIKKYLHFELVRLLVKVSPPQRPLFFFVRVGKWGELKVRVRSLGRGEWKLSGGGGGGGGGHCEGKKRSTERTSAMKRAPKWFYCWHIHVMFKKSAVTVLNITVSILLLGI